MHIISDIWQYDALDERILDDCRLIWEAESLANKRAAQQTKAARR